MYIRQNIFQNAITMIYKSDIFIRLLYCIVYKLHCDVLRKIVTRFCMGLSTTQDSTIIPSPFTKPPPTTTFSVSLLSPFSQIEQNKTICDERFCPWQILSQTSLFLGILSFSQEFCPWQKVIFLVVNYQIYFTKLKVLIEAHESQWEML